MIPVAVRRFAGFALPALLLAAPVAAQGAGGVYELAEVDAPPEIQNLADFQDALGAGYPAALRAAETEGRTVVSFVVGADGVPRELALVEATHAEFGDAALGAAALLRFVPARRGDTPVPVRIVLPIEWRLPERSPAPPRDWELPPEVQRELDADTALSRRLREVPGAPPGAREEIPVPLNRSEMLAELLRTPSALRRSGAHGSVTVRFLVDVDGRTRLAHVTTSSDPRMDAAALRAIARLRFRPARLDGRPVPVWIVLPLDWSAGR